MKKIRKLFYRIFKRYHYYERISCSYSEADALILGSAHKEEHERWDIDNEYEDHNHTYGMVVFLCRRKRITE